jgi:D-alanyl-D-alanine dipeptidase
MKPYQLVPIQECHEPLVEIPPQFARETPHPYLRLSAPYSNCSPYYLRQGVLNRLLQAQVELRQVQPDWNIQIFDAYRPIPVQQFMVKRVTIDCLSAANNTSNSNDETNNDNDHCCKTVSRNTSKRRGNQQSLGVTRI